MVDDHSKANDPLKSIAGRKNIVLPADVGARHKAAIDTCTKRHDFLMNIPPIQVLFWPKYYEEPDLTNP